MKELILLITLIITGIAYLHDRKGQKKFNDFCEQQEKRNEEDLFI